MKTKQILKEDAVSPVVGIMLMLVVTIIIAAVVSGFAGSITGSEKKAPTMTAETTIVNTGLYYGSHFDMKITGVSEPIPTRDLKITTSWTAKNGVKNSTTILPNVPNKRIAGVTSQISPLGTGPGVTFKMFNQKDVSQDFGNYTLFAGTTLRVYPMGLWGPTSDPSYGGYGPNTATYQYVDGTGYTYATDIDSMQAMLGKDWFNLREGDVVNVKIIHAPSGKVIYDDNVAVRGA
ncbi:MAG: hypothetical protein A4E35_01088 [Methanoregula sp. PtaU1.Bin051]|nr:MAG: hypothetical protein A4E35_01088 [Methanoregula sp. PtaU1.Bin051]